MTLISEFLNLLNFFSFFKTLNILSNVNLAYRYKIEQDKIHKKFITFVIIVVTFLMW